MPGFITAMDAVHMGYDRAPFPAGHVLIGKEVYPRQSPLRMLCDGSLPPTVAVYMHSNAVRWVKHVGSIFPGAHNDKTAVRFDNLVSAMRNDALIASCEWDTSVPATNGQTY